MDDNEEDRLKRALDATYDSAGLDKSVHKSDVEPEHNIGLLWLL